MPALEPAREHRISRRRILHRQCDFKPRFAELAPDGGPIRQHRKCDCQRLRPGHRVGPQIAFQPGARHTGGFNSHLTLLWTERQRLCRDLETSSKRDPAVMEHPASQHQNLGSGFNSLLVLLWMAVERLCFRFRNNAIKEIWRSMAHPARPCCHLGHWI